MRTIVSTFGTASYGITKYPTNIIQRILNKNKNKIKNSLIFINQAKEWTIYPNEIQVSYDIFNLYPPVRLDKAIQVKLEFLQDDSTGLTTRSKLNLTDMHKLLEICLRIH